jgi:integrase
VLSVSACKALARERVEVAVAKMPLELGTWGNIWTNPVRFNPAGDPIMFEARAYYRDTDGKTRQVAANGKNKTLAANKLRKKLRQRTVRNASDGLRETDRFGKGAEQYMSNLKALIEEGVRSPTTFDTYKYQLSKNLLPRLGELRFYEVTPPAVSKVIEAIKIESGLGSAKTCKSIISRICALAVRDGALAINPVREIELVRTVRASATKALTDAEREQWFELLTQDPRAVQADLIDVCKFMLATGERIGETLAVTWGDVFLDTGEVNCEHQIVRVRGQGLVRRRVKSDAGERVLGLPAWAVEMLTARRGSDVDLSAPVFPSSTGTFRDPHNVRTKLRAVRQPVGSVRRQELGKALRAYRRAAGMTQDSVVAKLAWKKTRLSLIETGRVALEQDDVILLANTYGLSRRDRAALLELGEVAGLRSVADELSWVTPHKFRKTTATILDDAGQSPRQVADQLGHARTSTTQDDYIARKQRNPAAAEALERALRGIHEQYQQESEGLER